MRKVFHATQQYFTIAALIYHSACSSLDLHNSRKLGLPLVTVLNQLLLIVKKLLVKECRVLKVRSFNDSIDRACFLAESTEDALRHIDIILGCPSRAVGSRLGLDSDSECRAGSLAQLASNASLFTGRVATQGVLASEHW